MAEEKYDSNKHVQVIEVVVTYLTMRGSGRGKGETARRIRQVWTLDGELIAEHDPFPEDGA